MIAPIRDRRTFEALRARGIRARSGPLAATFLGEVDGTAVRVAYAIPKRAGGAVQRNRVRRRLRALVAQATGDPAHPFPPGALVVTAGPEAAHRSSEELRIDVERLLTALERRWSTGETR